MLKRIKDWKNKRIYITETMDLQFLRKQYKGFIHFSFDDVQICLHNLNFHKNEFISIFDDPFLKQLKILHERYDAKFSLYVYLEDFLKLDNTWRLEFSTNSSWLKFGLHARNDIENYDNSGYNEANSDYRLFCEKVLEVCGTPDCLDRIPRLHNFGASLAALKGMHDAKWGIYGVLTADDNRNTLYISSEQQHRLKEVGYYFEKQNELMFFATNIRLDWFDKRFKSKYIYNKPCYGKPYYDFIDIWAEHTQKEAKYPMIVFTHEWKCYSQNNVLLPVVKWVEEICEAALACNIRFEFPQNLMERYMLNF